MIFSHIISSLNEDELSILLYVNNVIFKEMTENFDVDNIKFIRQDVLKAKLEAAEQHMKDEHKDKLNSLRQKLGFI